MKQMKSKTKHDLSKGSTLLNKYHQKRSKNACLAVEKISKQSYSLQQMRDQALSVKIK